MGFLNRLSKAMKRMVRGLTAAMATASAREKWLQRYMTGPSDRSPFQLWITGRKMRKKKGMMTIFPNQYSIYFASSAVRTASTASSMVIWVVSMSTASSACLRGA